MSENNEVNDEVYDEVLSKRIKCVDVNHNKCIICGSSDDKVHPPKDRNSWLVLYDVAIIRNFQPILGQYNTSTKSIPNIAYHRSCRANFTNKKTLKYLKKLNSEPEDNSKNLEGNVNFRVRPTRNLSKSSTRIYNKVCVFCDKATKYQKRSNTREPLTLVVELRTDKRLRELAVQRCDSKILAITSREIVAAEAHYHKTCYIQYTRERPAKPKTIDPYHEAEKLAYTQLYKFIRENLFGNPRVESQNLLLSKLISFIHESEVRTSTKKNFQYNLEKEFGSSLRFVKVDGRIFIAPDNLTYDMLMTEYVRANTKLEEILNEDAEFVKPAAEQIRKEIKSIDVNKMWPPSPPEMHIGSVNIPSSLTQFLQHVIGDNSARGARLSWSIAQDIIYAVFRGAVLTPKHVLLPMTVKTLTGNVQSISILNRLGHGCSYTKLLEIDTALCLEKISAFEEEQMPLPSSIHANIPTIVAFDNIDRNEETFSGSGTSHRVNGIIIQPTSATCLPPRLGMYEKKRRSIEISDLSLPEYIAGKRKNPPPTKTAELPSICASKFLKAKCNNLFWIISRQSDPMNQKVGAWTGFNITVRNNVDVQADTVAYLPSINSPATHMSTVYEILNQCAHIESHLNLPGIVLVLDQAIFCKAVEIIWSHADRFRNIFPMMGNFHTICILLSIIGKLFGDAGLRDLAVESGIVAEGSINKVLQGKQYNRAIRLHKYVYEAFMRVIWKKFLNFIEKNLPKLYAKMNFVYQHFNEFVKNMNNETMNGILENTLWKKLSTAFNEYLEYLKSQNGPLTSFWMTYIDLVELLLGFLRSNREGNWSLFLICIQEMIPWCFAMDKVNYARYLSINFAEMSQLEKEKPAIYEQLKSGSFSVQLGSKNPFGRIPVDQTLEETVNKDTQTAGGTKGFSLKPGAIAKYYITAEYRASALRKMRELLDGGADGKFYHPDLRQGRMKKDEECVTALMELICNEWTNPFDENPSDIVNLSTGALLSTAIQENLLKVKEIGEKAYEDFKSDRLEKGEGFFDPIKKIQLKSFTLMKEVKRKLKNNTEVILKADRNLFGNMILIAEKRKLDMLAVFSHPLGPLPWSLANADGTLKKTNKAAFGEYLVKLVAPSDFDFTSSAIIIDAMALIQKFSGEHHTFEEVSSAIFHRILNVGRHSQRIDIVFDVYCENSIKAAERLHRGSDDSISFKEIKSGHKIINWRRLLRSSDSKNKLIRFLVENWQTEMKRQLLGSKTLFVAYEEKCIKITATDVDEVNELASNHEEADTRMMLHIKHAASEYLNVICAADDTDVLILCLYTSLYIHGKCNIYVKRGTKNRMRLINVRKLVSAIGSSLVEILPSFHAWTGCDTVSCFAGQGKVKPLKIIQKNCDDFIPPFASLGSSWFIAKGTFSEIEKFVCQIYSRNTKLEKLNEMRKSIYRSKQGSINSGQLPPCADCLYQHTLRANYQAAIWRRCLENFPEIPSPEDHGWMVNDSGELEIKWMSGLPAPEAVLQLLKCMCPRSCKLPTCTCLSNNLKCTPACKLENCENMSHTENDDSADFNSICSSDSDDEC